LAGPIAPYTPSWLQIAVLYAVGFAAGVIALIGGALAWEALSWQPAHMAELPSTLLQFCAGGALATAAGFLATCCLVPAFIYHGERRCRSSWLPRARLLR
jgi:hypothetical protein